VKTLWLDGTKLLTFVPKKQILFLKPEKIRGKGKIFIQKQAVILLKIFLLSLRAGLLLLHFQRRI
jgi:hypothetical protein